MAYDNDGDLRKEPAFKRLQSLSRRISARYSLLVLGLFALFVIASALFRERMAASIFDGGTFTMAMLAALLLVVLPVAMATAFLRTSERDIAPLRAKLAEMRQDHGRATQTIETDGPDE